MSEPVIGPRPAHWGIAIAFVIVYGLVLYWFGTRDFYHQDFFVGGTPVRHYEWARLVFIFCFSWLIYATGVTILSILTGVNNSTLPPWERYPLGYLTGVAFWSVILYGIGLASLYNKPLGVDLTVAVMLASVPHLASCIQESAAPFLRFRTWISSNISISTSSERISATVTNPFRDPWHTAISVLQAFTVATIALAIVGFLLVKGLYPAGGHDYYNHYFPYFVRVVQTGSTLPNDVWYHFYQSKGDGLYFLAMILTDPLAPQLVTAGFILCGGWIVYALLRRVGCASPLPWIGALLFFALFIYTPGPYEFMIQGGWGDLEKEHELTAIPILGVIWSMVRLVEKSDSDARPWIVGLHASILATIIVTLQLGLLIGLYLTGLMVWFAAKRQWRRARIALFGGVTAALAMIVILTINYILTGLILDQAILFTWPFTNVAKLAAWGPLYEALNVHKAMGGLAANAADWSDTIFWLLPTYLRLEIWWPLVVVVGLFSILRLIRTRITKHSTSSTVTSANWVLLWFAGTVCLTAVFGGGRSQPVTFYRLTSFSYAPTLCFGLVLWQYGVNEGPSGTQLRRNVFATLLIAFILLGITSSAKSTGDFAKHRGNIESIVRNAAALVRGRYSIADAFQNQQGWPGRMPWGGIYPGVREPWRIVPARSRVWSFHIWTYCMLPDCNFQGNMSFIFSPEWRTVYFDTPEHARDVLRREGLNYFFFSKSMRIEDSIGHAALFSPDHIAENLAIRWTNGTDYLLTWPGPSTRPIGEDFLSSYRQLTAESSTYSAFNVQEWKTIAEEIRAQEATGAGLRPFPLPWCYNLAACFGDRPGH